ncbi:hypothetical protein E3N88_41597 [Mikania micrantha]|uniref:Uncharacterized protein n=1 Tax=Mikania micrantha TaxID=192012 RepID=A0A5N6LK66_9ASTR|nr:hypothetical protein E3N88_41597 [Mikania micrantha]
MVKDTDAIVDIESNQSECEEDPRTEQVTGSKRVKNTLRSLGLTLSFNKVEDDPNNRNSCSDDGRNDTESLINNKFDEERRENMTKTHLKEKQKMKNSKKAPKPPRPRRGPTLSTSDLRLVKEISELVIKKRARIERLKSLRKLRSAQAPSSSSSSSNISLLAMMITLLCLIVIILQGFGSRTAGLVSGHFDSRLTELNK